MFSACLFSIYRNTPDWLLYIYDIEFSPNKYVRVHGYIVRSNLSNCLHIEPFQPWRSANSNASRSTRTHLNIAPHPPPLITHFYQINPSSSVIMELNVLRAYICITYTKIHTSKDLQKSSHNYNLILYYNSTILLSDYTNYTTNLDCLSDFLSLAITPTAGSEKWVIYYMIGLKVPSTFLLNPDFSLDLQVA